MANTLTFVVSSITADRTLGILTNSTTYGTPARPDTALFVKGYKMNNDATVSSTLTVNGDQADPLTDSEFTFNVPADGWFRFNIVSIPTYTVGTYDQYNVVYDVATSKTYRSLQDDNAVSDLTITDYWEEIAAEDVADLAENEGEENESENIDSLIYEPGLFPNGEYSFANQISEGSEEYLSSLNIPDDDLTAYTLMAILLDGAYVNADRSEMSAAERKSRRLESIVESRIA